jgi:hypothetical protein
LRCDRLSLSLSLSHFLRLHVQNRLKRFNARLGARLLGRVFGLKVRVLHLHFRIVVVHVVLLNVAVVEAAAVVFVPVHFVI